MQLLIASSFVVHQHFSKNAPQPAQHLEQNELNLRVALQFLYDFTGFAFDIALDESMPCSAFSYCRLKEDGTRCLRMVVG